jgi:hypothetical protein
VRVFENRVQRRIFGPKRDEVTGEWRRLHNEELLTEYYCVIKTIKKWTGHVARVWWRRGAYWDQVGKPKERRPLEVPKRRFKDNTKMDVHGMGWKAWAGLI